MQSLIPPTPDGLRRVVGCMSGTSLDGLDIAKVEITGQGHQLEVVSISHAHVDLGALGPRLTLARDGALSAGAFTSLAYDLGVLHAQTIAQTWPDEPIDLVACHGQTLYHAPPHSLQLINPWPIAHALRAAVVTDLRGHDLAAGGQGAPITPLADRVLYRDHIGSEGLIILNLGGFANLTILPGEHPGTPQGFDCCPCNHLLDAVAREHLGQPYDPGGETAMQGTPVREEAQALAKAISTLNAEGRSGGTGDEGVELVLSRNTALHRSDLLATIVDAIAQAIAMSLQQTPATTRMCLAGGGAHNAALRRAMKRFHQGEVVTSDQLGIPIEAREAAAMAILGALAADGLPITSAEITGHASEPLRAGLWTLPHPHMKDRH